MDIYEILRQKLREVCLRNNLSDEHITVTARALTIKEAIGDPEDKDFPLQQGKEFLMQADFKGAFGQAFTDHYGDFSGSINDVLKMELRNNFRRALFVATLNAVLRSLGLIEGTVHCKDESPKECANVLTKYISEHYGIVKITQIGFQPRMIESLSSIFNIRVLDMDKQNIGTEKFGISIEGPEKTDEAVEWADILLVTGTVLVNDTITSFLSAKPTIFYGTTIAGAAHLMGWERFCSRSA